MQRGKVLGLLTVAAAIVPPAAHQPVASSPGFALVASSRPAIARGSTYKVREGDTLARIASRASVRVADIVAANALRNPDLIRVGQVLTIPRGPVSKQGDPGPAPAAASLPTLRPGAVGPPVADLQRRLTAAGHELRADGAFGPKTAAAVIAFQTKKGLQPDGIVGPKTWGALASAGATPVSQPKEPPKAPDDPWQAYGAATYTTRSGDTWKSVAKAKGSTPDALAVVNRRKTSEKLAAGIALLVPGAWRCPVPGAVFINDWGFPRAGGRTHQGNDLFAARGRPVMAPVGGDAVRQPNGLGGNAVQLHGDDGNRYYFAHLDAYGTTGRVGAGTVIGTVGNSGNAGTTVTHLHFEVHPGGGAAVNPYPTLTLACRR